MYEIRNLLLVGGEVSKNLSEILHSAYLFPKIELENDGKGLKYRVLGEKVRLKDYYQLIERELATEAYQIKLNPEDILESGFVEEAEVSGLFNVDTEAKYCKIKLKKDIVLFLILLIEQLRAKENFRMRTAYVDSEFYFEFHEWNHQLYNLKRENLCIYWRWQGYWWWSSRIQLVYGGGGGEGYIYIFG